MAISYIGRGGGTTTATVPSHAIGDLILIFAFRDGSTSAPALPAGYTSINTRTATSCSMRVGYKIATATNDTSGTWTSATTTIAHVYRGVDPTSPIGNNTPASGTTATTTFAATTAAGSNSWFVGFAGSRVASTTISAPAGMTSRGATSDTTDSAVGCDTNGTSSGWSAATVTVSATGWCSAVVEIKERPTSRTMSFSIAETEVITAAIDKSNPNVKELVFSIAETESQAVGIKRLRDQPGSLFNGQIITPSGADTANSVTYNSTTGETAIELDQGSTFEHTFTLTVNSMPFDLTDYDARMQVRKSYGASAPWYSATIANAKIVITKPVSGALKVIFVPSDTSSVKFNSPDDSTLDSVFDLELQHTSTGKVFKPVRGTIILTREVTR